jgi:hypothetical protein
MECAVCHVELTAADADDLVKTDAGPVHRECFEGPVPPGGPSAEEVIESGFFVAGWGASWQLTEDGWLVNGEPYNPDEDGVHQPQWTPEEIEEEEEARRDHGDVPLPELLTTTEPGSFFRSADNEVDGRPEREALEKMLRDAGEAPLDLSGPKIVVHPSRVAGWKRFFGES